MAGTEEFERLRPRLFGLAYRMLGSAFDAEDVVQDAWLRWAGAERDAIESAPAWLTTVTTRLCLTRLTSAKARRETYPGPWLPEPVPTAEGLLGPLDTVELRDSVSLALLVTLERLSPAERAVYVLHEAFGYPHRDIAEVLALTEANCRQLYHRARRHLDEQRVVSPAPDRASVRRLVERFLAAARAGDLPALESLLAADVSAWADGGGKVKAARRPLYGVATVARYVAGVLGPRSSGVRSTLAEVNGAWAVLGWTGERLTGVLVLDTAGDRVDVVRFLVNPDKLTFLESHTVRSASQAEPSRPDGLSGPC